MNKFFSFKIYNIKIKILLILIIIGILCGFVCKTKSLINSLKQKLNDSYKLIDQTNDQMKIMDQKLLIMSQQINSWKINNMNTNQYDIETPSDSFYYKYIKENNSFSNPLTDRQIWEIITELKNCKTDPNLLLAIAKAESSFNASAISTAGCIGLMQINPIHANEYKFSENDLFNPIKSIQIADRLIVNWQKDGKLSTSEICKKYLGCHSDKYLSKITNNLYNIKNHQL